MYAHIYITLHTGQKNNHLLDIKMFNKKKEKSMIRRSISITMRIDMKEAI